MNAYEKAYHGSSIRHCEMKYCVTLQNLKQQDTLLVDKCLLISNILYIIAFIYNIIASLSSLHIC